MLPASQNLVREKTTSEGREREHDWPGPETIKEEEGNGRRRQLLCPSEEENATRRREKESLNSIFCEIQRRKREEGHFAGKGKERMNYL